MQTKISPVSDGINVWPKPEALPVERFGVYYLYMLQLSESLLNQPIMSLRTGQQVGTTTEAIINPNNLKIEGFYCQDKFEKNTPMVLLYQDIRDIIAQGFVVDDHEVLAAPEELVRLKEVLDIHFTLIGKPVVTTAKEHIGKVSNFATELETMYVQKIYVSRSVLKSFGTASLGVDRSQINEITDRQIVINELLKGTAVRAGAIA